MWWVGHKYVFSVIQISVRWVGKNEVMYVSQIIIFSNVEEYSSSFPN